VVSVFYKKVFEEKWSSTTGGLLLAILNTFLFLYSGPIGATNAVISTWGRWVYNAVLIKPESPLGFLQRSGYLPQCMIYIGLMLGVFLSALAARQFSIRKEGISGYIQGFAGGALMGIGSFLAGGCLLGGFYSGIMGLSLNGFVMMMGLLVGAYLGGRFVIWQINRQTDDLFIPHPEKEGKKHPVKRNRRDIQPWIAIMGWLIVLGIISLDRFIGGGFPSAAFLSGILFGVVFQRSGFCFVAAFRELFVTKTTRMMRSLTISLIVGVTGFSLIMVTGLKPPIEDYIFHTNTGILVGGLIFGFGMTITGG